MTDSNFSSVANKYLTVLYLLCLQEIQNFGNYETILPQMDVTKMERIPLTLEGVKPMMGVRTFDKKVFPEIIKA